MIIDGKSVEDRKRNGIHIWSNLLLQLSKCDQITELRFLLIHGGISDDGDGKNFSHFVGYWLSRGKYSLRVVTLLNDKLDKLRTTVSLLKQFTQSTRVCRENQMNIPQTDSLDVKSLEEFKWRETAQILCRIFKFRATLERVNETHIKKEKELPFTSKRSRQQPRLSKWHCIQWGLSYPSLDLSNGKN